MNADLAQELLNELGASLQDLETRQTALFQFLKDKEIFTDDEIAPYLEQAGKVSSVRWRAAHIRLESLIRVEKQKEEELKETELRKTRTGDALSGQNQKPQAETEDKASSAKAAPKNQEARTDGPVESGPKQPVSNKKDDVKDESAATTDKKPNPSPEATK